MSTIGCGTAGKMLNFDVADFTTHESNLVLLVSVHNIVYPITEHVLHRVFDPYGYVEKIDILRSSEPQQVIIQFDSCQNAVSAKNQLQGRYIYDRCCQLDIQFYKKNDYEDKTENTLMDNEFATNLDFIRNKLHEMMVIIERMQDRMKAINSSRSDAATLVTTPPLLLPATVTSTTTAGPYPSKSTIPFFPLYDTSDPAALTNEPKTVNPKLKPNPSPQSLDLGKLKLHSIPQESMVSPYLQLYPDLLANPIIYVDKPSENATTCSRASPLPGSHNLPSAIETKMPAQAKALILTDLSIASSNSIRALLAPRPELISKQSIAVKAGVINTNYVDYKLNFGDRSARVERIKMPNVVEGSKRYNSFSVTAFEHYHNSTFRLSGSIPYATFHGENGSHKQTDIFALGWNGEDKTVLTFDPGGDKHDAKGFFHVLNHALDPKVMWLSTFFYDPTAITVIVENEKMMENNGLCDKNYISFLMGLKFQYGKSIVVRNYCLKLLRDWVECKIKIIESKDVIFDPGGIYHGDQDTLILTLNNYAHKLYEVMLGTYNHALFAPMLDENERNCLSFEKVVSVFDPGGDAFNVRVFFHIWPKYNVAKAYFSLSALGNILDLTNGSYNGWYKIIPSSIIEACSANFTDIKPKEGSLMYRCFQNVDEFIVTFFRTYHSCFNYGFNLAEALKVASTMTLLSTAISGCMTPLLSLNSSNLPSTIISSTTAFSSITTRIEIPMSTVLTSSTSTLQLGSSKSCNNFRLATLLSTIV